MKIHKINEVNAISKHAVIIMKPELSVENPLVDAIIRKIAIVQREAFHRMPKILRLKNNSFGVEIITSGILDLILNYATNLVRTCKRNSTLVHRINVVDQNIKTKLKKSRTQVFLNSQ